ncbi:carboxylesterase family protein [Catenuloplanes atrovinosus]|uniref:Carboxylic ester hydrolase n=1 Tax=Catenuloplanes atrovinosus TaxID=137266 RepID=A0AAE4CD38_9ACTN|nr:carboxylesterase family protein [Catenuloplanes atrovinosus]MDR7277140.1 para-nitrobenzyl esterase [Catenuloplanes atrovinosus]
MSTTNGIVRGLRLDGHVAFLDIPYAAAPVGAGRFAAPEPHAPWDGVRDATVPGPTAPQAERRLGDIDMSAYFDGWHRGEDYLTVTVRTPDPAATGLPVMVFVHGGGFVAGSNRAALYDGSSFARDGVVLVTVNYRLGIAGFLDLPGAPANRGLLDVIAALRWVRSDIAAFGGDPDNVTLFGQSAGATIVGGVLATPEAAGLMRRAIVQSGSGLGAFTREQGARVTAAAAEILGVPAHADAFAEVGDELLVEAAGRLAGLDLRTRTAFDPLVGLSPFSLVLDAQPADALAADVDLLAGVNAEEGNLYLIPVGRYATSTAADVDAVASAAHPDPARLLAAYRSQDPAVTAPRLRAAVLGDALFGAGTWALLDAHARRADRATFAYEFTWRSPALGAAHAVELPFVFDNLDHAAVRGENRLLGAGDPPADLAARVHHAWIRFARTGDPGWPPYDTVRRTTMRIGEVWERLDDPRGPQRRAWSRDPDSRAVVTTTGAPVLPAPLAQGVRKGPVLQVSGQLPLDPTTGAISGRSVAEQTDRALRNVIAVLDAGGASLADVVMLRVYLTDPGHLPEMNTAYAAIVGEPYPARTTMYMPLPPGMLVEVDALAVLG